LKEGGFLASPIFAKEQYAPRIHPMKKSNTDIIPREIHIGVDLKALTDGLPNANPSKIVITMLNPIPSVMRYSISYSSSNSFFRGNRAFTAKNPGKKNINSNPSNI
jgi:hypothetical protein